MIWTVANTSEAGRPVKRVVDANGLDWTHTVVVDTESGRIVHQKTDENGKRIFDEKGVVLVEVFTAAPIMVFF